jgi:hypothetical protein
MTNIGSIDMMFLEDVFDMGGRPERFTRERDWLAQLLPRLILATAVRGARMPIDRATDSSGEGEPQFLLGYQLVPQRPGYFELGAGSSLSNVANIPLFKAGQVMACRPNLKACGFEFTPYVVAKIECEAPQPGRPWGLAIGAAVHADGDLGTPDKL